MNEEIKVGDTVQLKSGGPIMTVKFIENDEVCCQWFAVGKRLEEMFGILTLKKFKMP